MSQIIKPTTGGGPSNPDLHVARFIVSAGGSTDGANYTSIATAYAAAVAAGGNQTIFLQPGTYNIGTLVLSPNIGITAYDCDGVIPNVILNGKMTANFTGVCAFSGIYFVNNSDNVLAVTGSGACEITFIDCWIQVGGTAFAVSNSNASAYISFETCQGDITGTSAFFDFSAGAVNINNSAFINSVESSTANNFTTSSIGIQSSIFNSPISKVGLGGLALFTTSMICLNDTCITISNALNNDLVINNSLIDSNNATAITIGTGNVLTIANTAVGSNATDAISGTGTLKYSPIAFTKSSSTVSVSTQTPIRFGPQISPELANTNGTVYYDGTIIATVAPGTAGQVLTSNGAGSPPSYQTPSGGSPTILSVGMNSAQTLTQNTLATVIYDTAILDTSSGYNAGTGVYTVPATGNYEITVTGNFVSTAGFINADLFIDKNSGTYLFHGSSTATVSDPNRTVINASIVTPLTINDTIQMAVFAQTTGGTNYTAAAQASGYYNTMSIVSL